jgi:hypothetical protein
VKRWVEIRSYDLKPASRGEFHETVVREAIPMLRRWKVDVVAFRPSLHEEDSYDLIRSYASLADRQQSQDAFHGSEEWKQGPRERVVGKIESTTSVVLELDDATVDRLRSA